MDIDNIFCQHSDIQPSKIKQGVFLLFSCSSVAKNVKYRSCRKRLLFGGGPFSLRLLRLRFI